MYIIIECYHSKIVGLGTNSDNNYRQYSTYFSNIIIECFDEFSPFNLAEIIEKYNGLMHFHNPLNLTKMNQYKKMSNEKFFIPSHEIDIIKDLSSL